MYKYISSRHERKHVRIYVPMYHNHLQLLFKAQNNQMKRRRIGTHEKPSTQFDSLRNIRGMTNAARREVVAAYTTTSRGSGARAASRAQHVFPYSKESLRSMRIPTGSDSEDLEVWYFSLLQHLAAKVDGCPLYKAALRQCLQKGLDGNRLRLIFYVDECTAGNVVDPDPQRKAHLVYISFIDMPLLGRDSLWLTMAVFRTADMLKTSQGITGATRALLEAWRKESDAGVPLDVGNGPELCWIDSVVMLADAEGLRAISGTKGASGTKPCLKCANVLSHQAAANEIGGHYSIAESNYQLLQPMSQERLEEILAHITSLRTKKEISEAETLLGWNLRATQNSFLCSPILRPWLDVTHCHFDSMHIYYSNGIVGQEIGYWWEKILDTTDITHDTLLQYVKTGWQISTPRGNVTLQQVHNCFKVKLWKKGVDYRGDSSQTMTVLPVLAHFQEEIARPCVRHIDAEFNSLLALAEVVLCVQDCKHSKSAPAHADKLLRLQQEHLKLFATAYGAEWVRPKGHYAFHVPEQIREWGKLLDTFTPERKHRAFKSEVAPLQTQLQSFSKHVLLELGEKELRTQGDAAELQLTMGISAPAPESLLIEIRKSLRGPIQISREATNETGQTFLAQQFLILSPTVAVEILLCACAAQHPTEIYLYVIDWEPYNPNEVHNNPMGSVWKKTTLDPQLIKLRNLQSQAVFLARHENLAGKPIVTLLR